MILLCGIPTETPLALVRSALDSSGAEYLLFNQRRFAQTHLEFEVAHGQVTGMLEMDGQRLRLESVNGVYTRIMDDQALPEVSDLPPEAPQRAHCRALHDALNQWLDIAPARVVNRSIPMGSNSSKPYQAQLIARCGFSVPETLITNDPEQVEAFRAQHGTLVYKSISGVRSIVAPLESEDWQRIERIRWCPTQFQAFVEGTNVRVHVVDDRVFATRIQTAAVDYRYAHRQGDSAELVATELDDDLAARCVLLARSLELPFAGIDLKITPEGEAYCFEVNPSPGFSYYETATGQPISMTVARYLCGF